MKQLLTVLLITCSLFANAQDSTGKFTVKAPLQVWQQLLDALDKSDASNLLIKDLKKFIVDQVQSQVQRSPQKEDTKQPVKKEGKKD